MEIVNIESFNLLFYFICRKNNEFYETNLRFGSISGFSITELRNIQSKIIFLIALKLKKINLFPKLFQDILSPFFINFKLSNRVAYVTSVNYLLHNEIFIFVIHVKI
jgi:hypothetical protein